MTLTVKTPNPYRNHPSLTPKQAETYTGGAVTYAFLKRDRAIAEANGTIPMVPYYRIGHRTVKYRPSDLEAYLESMRVG